jgi:uncharacterized coiled-coil DUF342 family protein
MTMEEMMRAHGDVLEDIRSLLAALLEATKSTETTLRAEIRELRRELSERISILEEVVRQSSADILTLGQGVGELRQRTTRVEREVAELRLEVTELRRGVTGLRHDFDHREERGRLSSLEARVAAVETRLGIPVHGRGDG